MPSPQYYLRPVSVLLKQEQVSVGLSQTYVFESLSSISKIKFVMV